jgi:hypothetical protein
MQCKNGNRNKNHRGAEVKNVTCEVKIIKKGYLSQKLRGGDY